MVLDLVDCRDNGSLGKEFLKVLHTVVGDTDGLDLAGVQELLHAFPGGDVGVRVVDVAGAVCVLGEKGVIACPPVNKLRRHLINAKANSPLGFIANGQ